MNVEALPPTIVLAAALFIGIRSTFRLRRDVKAIEPFLTDRRNRLIGQAFVVVSEIIILAVGYFAIRTAMRLLGIEAPEWTAGISFIVSLPALFIPRYLETVWRRVGG